MPPSSWLMWARSWQVLMSDWEHLPSRMREGRREKGKGREWIHSNRTVVSLPTETFRTQWQSRRIFLFYSVILSFLAHLYSRHRANFDRAFMVLFMAFLIPSLLCQESLHSLNPLIVQSCKVLIITKSSLAVGWKIEWWQMIPLARSPHSYGFTIVDWGNGN